MRHFVYKLLQQANLPVTYSQFWWYTGIFWGVLAIISYVQSTMVWLLSGQQVMHISESVQWFITYLLWLGLTPFILYSAQRFSIRPMAGPCVWPKTIAIHVFIASALVLLVSVISFELVRPLHALETGRWMSHKTIWLWFFYSYSCYVVTYLLVVVGYNIISYTAHYQALKEQNLKYELNNEQLKTQLTSAQLQSLKMQLNPHFLFNTHHAIVSLMLQNENRKAIDMVTALSDMLRGVLAHQDKNFLTLRDELTLTQQYLSIQQIRFQDRLQIEYDIDPATEHCPVPQLLLQPLVENAVTHGVSSMTSGAFIRISTSKQGDKIQITVFDNGIGKSRSEVRRNGRSSSGLGLNNTRQRLKQAYGESAQFMFEQPPGGSTLITMTFPCQPDSQTNTVHENVSLAHY
jgi:sensor histidine kinase YesM